MKLERENKYNILLGGSGIAGKTSYINSYLTKEFTDNILSSIGINRATMKELNKSKFYIWDSAHWGKQFDGIIQKHIQKTDGVILIFDLSKKEDFEELPRLLDLITEFHELENFPVLLIGNKSDLDIMVDKNEIEKFLVKENFIGYFEVSCKIYKNVEESVDFMINYIIGLLRFG